MRAVKNTVPLPFQINRRADEEDREHGRVRPTRQHGTPERQNPPPETAGEQTKGRRTRVEHDELVVAALQRVVELVEAPDALERLCGGVQAHERGLALVDGLLELAQVTGGVVLVDREGVEPDTRGLCACRVMQRRGP